MSPEQYDLAAIVETLPSLALRFMTLIDCQLPDEIKDATRHSLQRIADGVQIDSSLASQEFPLCPNTGHAPAVRAAAQFAIDGAHALHTRQQQLHLLL